jgi:hypothetical protein
MISMNQQTEKRLLLTDTLPEFAAELRQLLIERGEAELACTGVGIDDFGAVLLAGTASAPLFTRDPSRKAASVPVIGMCA